MFRKRKHKPNKNDFSPDCTHSPNYDDLVEREVDGVKVMAFQCQMCNTYGRRPVAFIFAEDNIPIPDFDTLGEDTETELYYKLNFLSQVFPNKETQELIAKTKHELKNRFDALKYDNPKEGTRKHWLECEKYKLRLLKQAKD